MRIDVVSIFPDYLAPLALSLPGKAQSSGLLDLHVHDLRAWTHDRHRTVDDTPYGGGAGMVMKPEPWGEALDDLLPADRPAVLVVPTPSGRPFTQALAYELAGEQHLLFACGRYEGIDQRVMDHAATRVRVLEISIGDYVLNGGEVAAMAVIEAVVRLLPGFMGNPESLTEESHSSGLLEYPVYTKPASWRGLDVPPVLLSGDHGKVAAWRHDQALRRTAERRPDLLHPSHAVAVAGVDAATVSPATPADLGEIQTLQWACFDERLDLEQIERDVTAGVALVLRAGGRLVGSVTARSDDAGAVWHIAMLMVAPDLRGRGIGRLLLDLAERAAPPDAATLRLFTAAPAEANLRFYKRAGYSVRGPRDGHPDVLVLTRRRA